MTNNRRFVYQVVYPNMVEMIDSPEALTARYEETGLHFSPVTRAELQGQPRLARFVGPMYNGQTPDGKHVIRYETRDYYNDMV